MDERNISAPHLRTRLPCSLTTAAAILSPHPWRRVTRARTRASEEGRTRSRGAQAPLYLTIDQGGHASRALLFNGRGKVVARATRTVQMHEPHPGWVEQDPEEIVSSVRTSMEHVMRGQDAAQVISAGLATQRSSIVCWEPDGRAISPVISWQDRRAHGWLVQFAPQREQVQESTGLMLSAHYGASKLRWCMDHIPAVRQAHERGKLRFGPLASYLVFRLTREHSFLIDPATAARTLLYSLAAHDWDRQLLELFGIPQASLPHCVPTRHSFGGLLIDGRTVPLAIVTGDQSAALFAFGRPEPAVAYVNIGTGAFVQRPCGQRPCQHPRLLASIVFDDRNSTVYVLEGTVNGAGSALQWVQREFGLDNIESGLAAWLERSGEPPLFLNGVGGLGSPFWVADFPSCFLGGGEPWQKAVAVAESIVFLLQTNLDELCKSSVELDHILISGGLAQLDGLCQRLADISRLPVYRQVEPEATARGIAYLLANHTEPLPDSLAGVWFYPTGNPSFADRYHRWRKAMDAALAPPTS
ncbi:MAG: FGGY family carbohydrate kinase [Acidiferrobacterales bacterium]